MIKIEITCATADDALAVVSKLAGVDVAVSSEETAVEKPKKETPTAKAKAATKEAFEEQAPKGRGRGKAKVPTAEELKDHILKVAGNDQPERIKEYVASYGVKKISDMDDAQRKDAFDGAEAFFADEDGEEDPMA